MKAALFFLPVISATMAYALKSEPTAGKLVQPQYQEVSECNERPEFLTEARTEIVGSIDKLPQMGVLIARDAEYYVEGKTSTGGPIRVHGYQSFLKADQGTKILCGQSPKNTQERYSMLAPTLIDTTASHQTGDSVWQFQMMADKDKYSSWNLKSPAKSTEEKIAKVLGSPGSSYRMYQITSNEYELMVIQQSHGVTQYLSVRYDAVASVK